jgi:hypothetical protein
MDFLPGSIDQINEDGSHLALDVRPLAHELRKSESRVRFNDDIKVTIIEDSPSEADTELEESSNTKKQDLGANTETVVVSEMIENTTAIFDKNEAKYDKGDATLGDKIQLENNNMDNKESPAASGEEVCGNVATGDVSLMVSEANWAIRLDCGNSTESAEAILDSKTEDGLSLEETEAVHKDFNEGMRGPGVKGEAEKQEATFDDKMTAEKAKEKEADADDFDVDIENSLEEEEESPKVGEISQTSDIFGKEVSGLNLADAEDFEKVKFRDDHFVDHVTEQLINDVDDHVSSLIAEILNGNMVEQTADNSANQGNGSIIDHVEDHGTDHVKDQVANHAVDHPADDVAFQGNAGLIDHVDDDHVPDHKDMHKANHDLAGHVVQELAGHVVQELAGHVVQERAGHVVQELAGYVVQELAGDVVQERAGHVVQELTGHVVQELGGHVVQELAGHVVQELAVHVVQELAGHVVQELAGHVVQELGGHVVKEQRDHMLQELAGHGVQELGGHVVQELAGHGVQELAGHVDQELAGHVVQELAGEDELVDVETIGNPEENFDFLILKVQ